MNKIRGTESAIGGMESTRQPWSLIQSWTSDGTLMICAARSVSLVRLKVMGWKVRFQKSCPIPRKGIIIHRTFRVTCWPESLPSLNPNPNPNPTRLQDNHTLWSRCSFGPRQACFWSRLILSYALPWLISYLPGLDVWVLLSLVQVSTPRDIRNSSLGCLMGAYESYTSKEAVSVCYSNIVN